MVGDRRPNSYAPARLERASGFWVPSSERSQNQVLARALRPSRGGEYAPSQVRPHSAMVRRRPRAYLEKRRGGDKGHHHRRSKPIQEEFTYGFFVGRCLVTCRLCEHARAGQVLLAVSPFGKQFSWLQSSLH